MAEHGDDKVGGNVIDHPGDEGATMESEVEDRMTAEVIAGEGATVARGDGDRSDQRPEVEDEARRREPVEESRAGDIKGCGARCWAFGP